MAAYSELIKNFDKIRDYVREFYIFGFRTRENCSIKSSRTYDNERRRIESWMSDHAHSESVGHKKTVSVKVDSSSVLGNPLYSCWKSRSYTVNDIRLHFILLDLLEENKGMTVTEITDRIISDYGFVFDPQIIRIKLKEYCDEGIVLSERSGKTVIFKRSDSSIKKLFSEFPGIKNLTSFFSGEMHFGVTGSFITDRSGTKNDFFTRKHSYIVHTLDDGIMYSVLRAMEEKRNVHLSCVGLKTQNEFETTGTPLMIRSSAQTGRNYIILYDKEYKRLFSVRTDAVRKVKICDVCEEYDIYSEYYERNHRNLWGTSFGYHREHGLTEHIHMELSYDPETEAHIPQRLIRECRGGTVTMTEPGKCSFDADLFDANEAAPWIKTFTGRITALSTDNAVLNERFYGDFGKMYRMYGGSDK